ncbi:adenine deaminase [Methanotorris igneus]|uniref:Adenine deaminase n=1 Tax=Methanotorris igneus (strain DSM 5666 / JCM 11834 / Kol 5) TaxID=880724 RepID=F6BEV8_METIK|nr:adenine deaminase [Methanotorris igneus]AEF95694.1 Adenine deaminase [Methanotorris igneus Kol 5]
MIVFKNGKIIDVYSGEIIKGNVGIEGDRIIFVDFDGNIEIPDAKIIDLNGRYISPTFIDAHIHIESSHIIPSEFEKFALKSGVTKVVIDPHEIANVLGREGILFMMNDAEILDVYVMIPSCVPATELETNGAVIGVEDIEELITLPNVLGLGEVMNYVGVINEDEEVIRKIEVVKRAGKLIDGHCPQLKGLDLCKYISHGIMSDHECTEEEEALEKLRLGLKLMVREGTASKNINLLSMTKKIKDKRNIMLVSDDVSIKDLSNKYMLNILRKATKYVSPVEAIQMVTINPANYFGFDVGIKPGNEASLIIFNDLNNFDVWDIVVKGKFLDEIIKEKSKSKNNGIKTVKQKSTINYNYKKKEDFLIEGIDYNIKDRSVRVIEPIEHSLITNEIIMDVEEAIKLKDKNKINKIFVLERHKNTNNIGKGLIFDFLKEGVVASSYAHDSHNVIVVGNDEEDIALAVNFLKDIGGGFVAVKDGEVVDYLKLYIGGIMGDDGDYVLEKTLSMEDKVKNWSRFEDIFLSMSFLSLPVIPELKITDKGLVKDMKIVDLFV